MPLRFRRNTFAMALAGAAFAGSAFAQEPVTLKVMSFNIWYGGQQVDFTQIIDTIRAVDADIVGIQEPDGSTLRIAAAAGYPYVDLRRHIISRVPLFDSGVGERTESGQTTYAMAALDSDAAHAWALVAPGQVVALANLHLSSDPYGPYMIRDGEALEDVLATEADTRVYELEPLTAALAPLVADGVPVIVTGDFNSPSHLDWVEATVGTQPNYTMPVAWPVTVHMEEAGFTDTYRAVHPDPLTHPGMTYSPGFPHPVVEDGQHHDRIDYVWAANAEILDSTLVGEANHPEAGYQMTPWPSDHRAVVTTMTVTPVTAPALIAVEPRLVTEGDTFVVRVNPPERADWGVAITPRGGNPETDTITSVAGVAAFWQTAFRFSTLGLAPGSYDAVMLDPDESEIARSRFSVVGPDGQAVLTIANAQAAVGEPLQVSWSGAPGMRFDWLGVFAADDPNLYNYLAFAYTGGVLDGEMELTPDLYYEELPPGDYILRLMADDHYVALAEAPFTITE